MRTVWTEARHSLSLRRFKSLVGSTLHLPLAHISSPISKTIHVSPLITTIKKNKIASLLFNVGLKIFTNSWSSLFTPHLYIYVVTFIHFNYLILKCSNKMHNNKFFTQLNYWGNLSRMLYAWFNESMNKKAREVGLGQQITHNQSIVKWTKFLLTYS